MNAPEDPSLRELFRESLRDEEDDAPSFVRLWSSAATSHHRRQRRVHVAQWMALAALLMVGALLAFRPSSPPQVPAYATLPWRSAILLTEWHSPTDALVSPAVPASLSFDLPH